MSYFHEDAESGFFLSRICEMDQFQSGTLGGRFSVKGILGKGTYSTVIKAYDQVRQEDVALKVAASDKCDPALARAVLEHECRVYSSLPEPRHLLRVHDLHHVTDIEGETLLCLSMEYADGGSLREWLRKNADNHERRLSEGPKYLKQILRGVREFHQNGKVHFDLKPENYLFVNGILKLSDLGAAGFTRSQLLLTDAREFAQGTHGTPEYMAPERFAPDHADCVDERADIYAIGCILYEMFSEDCRPPFGGSHDELRRCHISVVPPKLTCVPDKIARVVAKCLSKKI